MNIGPTLTAASAAAIVWDALVIGAGPAGALAARQLALSGARTLLVDRKAFPRPKVCGGCINERAISVLRAVRLEGLLSEPGRMPLRHWQLQHAGRAVRLPLPGGQAMSRARLDALLVREAIRAGAAFLPETSAIVRERTGSSSNHRLVQLTIGGSTELAEARVVLAADGLQHSSLSRSGEFRSRIAANARIGLGTILHEFPEDYVPDTVFMALGRGGYVGLVRIEDGALNVAAAVDPELVRHGENASAAVAGLLHAAGLPGILGLASTKWQGTPPLTRRTEPLASHRIFVLGDAAGYAEPFTGEGIAWALSAAAAVVPFALAGAGDWDDRLASGWAGRYRDVVGRRQWTCGAVTTALRRHPLRCGLFEMVSRFPRLAGTLVRRINGSPA